MDLQQIEYQSSDGRAYRGYVATPAAPGPHPAVLVAHEAPGLLEHSKRIALKLAGEGYVALAIDYLGEGRVLTTMREVMDQVGRWVADPSGLRLACRAAHELIRGRADVDPTRIAGFGYCYGGQALVEYARTGADLVAVVGFHPGMSVNRPVESASIKARLLMLVGSGDPITTAANRVAFEEEMDGAGVEWRLVVYGGAPHSFTNREAGEAGIPGVAYDGPTDEDSWLVAMRFLEQCGMAAGTRPPKPLH